MPIAPPPPQQSIPYIPRPGSIHKNSQVPPLQQQKHNNYRSIENKRKVLSVHEPSHNPSRSNYRISKDFHPTLKKGNEKKSNKTTNVTEIERIATNTVNSRSR